MSVLGNADLRHSDVANGSNGPRLCGNYFLWLILAGQREMGMAGFIEGVDRGQMVLFPDRLEDWIGEDSLVRFVDLFVGELDLPGLVFGRAAPARTGWPGYHPAVLLKLFIYGYLNRIPSSRRLEREAGRNVEVMWLTGRLVLDHKTIADFRREFEGSENDPGDRFP
jgi:transposase